MKFYNFSIEDTLVAVKSTRDGLTSAEARRRLLRDGPNEVRTAKVPLWKQIVRPFASVMMAVLIIAGFLSLWQGNAVDAAIIFAIIMVSALVDWVQEYSTSRILRRLREQETDEVEVMRNGQTDMVLPEELVVGDVILLHEGQKVPADARMLDSAHLHVDESMLTGESMSVRKSTNAIKGVKEVYDQANMVFSGSFVVTGAGAAVVTATANDTEFGKLALLASDSVSIQSPIQAKIDRLVQQVIVIIMILAVIVMIFQLLRGQSFIDALQFVLAFAVSAVPEGLPIAITAVLAMGMRRMAKHKALVRNMRAIESIGVVTAIATDKTGTLTENKLRVQETWSPRFNDMAFALQMSFALNTGVSKTADPLDQAIVSYLQTKKVSDPTESTQAKLVQALPFDYAVAMSGNVWQFGKSQVIYLKGAPEKIMSRCKLTALQQKQALAKLTDYTSRGYRVIAYCKCEAKHKITSLSAVPSSGLEFIGLTAVADQLRPRIENSVKAARAAGIKVCMITGDHSETAYNIAHTVGIADEREQVYDSHKLAKLTPDKLAQVVGSTRVYARVTPDVKHAILNELNKQEITAMTGDGVNDVPALTKAHVGIAMGSGSAIAKDASDVVLLDDNFRSIVVAVKEGRTIVANVRRMLVYLLATNAGEALVTVCALLLGMPLPLLAVQILWVNLATDTFLVIPLGVEPPRSDVMKRAPDHPDAPILDKYMIGQMIVSALTISVLSLATFAYFNHNHGLDYARSAVFLVLIVIQWVNAVSMRGTESVGKILRVRNRSFTIAIVGTMVLQLVVMLVPTFRQALHVNYLHSDAVIACILAAITALAMLEAYKAYLRRKLNDKRGKNNG